MALPAVAQKLESGTLFQGPGATLYYEIQGAKTGTPLLVINGGPGVDHGYMHSTLHPVSALDELAADRQVIFYDQRGVGKSPALRAGQSCTVADQVADIEALRAHLRYQRMYVFGHSFGGYLAMAYAVRYPERVEGLIICDSAAPRFSDTIFLFAQVFPETHQVMQRLRVTDESTNRAYFLHYFSMLFYSAKNRDSYLAAVTTINSNSAVADALHKDMVELDFTPQLASFHFPTLVLTGRFDMNVAPSVAYAIHNAIPGSRFVVFEQSGHLPFYEEQESFVRTVRGFLADIPD
ncbi:MAG: alpha/beta hydrolase [Desulforhopalus sp.]|nr:alpha/beta hydrolase [Desulforhopalus sp.]